MLDCPNCGMMPFACVCVPWCDDHDLPREICGCIKFHHKKFDAVSVVMIFIVLTTIVWLILAWLFN
jgi:hypothetical protein